MKNAITLFLAIFFALAAFSQEKTFTGIVSDSMCTTDSHMLKTMKAANDADCVRKCVKQSFDYVLVTGKDYYILKGNPAQFDKYAAQRVTVKGTLQGDTLTATSVTPAKASKPAAKKKTAGK